MLYMFYFAPQYLPSNGRTLPHRFLPTPLVSKRHSTRLESRNPFRVRPREVNGHSKDAGGATGVPQEIAGGAEGRAG
jgi:hypothetical protein